MNPNLIVHVALLLTWRIHVNQSSQTRPNDGIRALTGCCENRAVPAAQQAGRLAPHVFEGSTGSRLMQDAIRQYVNLKSISSRRWGIETPSTARSWPSNHYTALQQLASAPIAVTVAMTLTTPHDNDARACLNMWHIMEAHIPPLQGYFPDIGTRSHP